jgi:hypothetical protein
MKRLLTALAALMFAAIVTQTLSAQDPFPLAPWKRKEVQQINDIDAKVSAPRVAPLPSPVQIATGTDPALLERFNQHESAIGELRSGLRDVNGKVDALSSTTKGGFETLAQKFAEHREQEQAAQPQANKFQQDAAAIKDTIHDDPLRALLVTIGVTVAVFFFVTVCVFHLVAAFRQKADATAKANPDNQFDQKAAQFFDKLDDFNQKVDVKLAAQPLIGKLWQPGGAAGAVAPATAADVQQAAVQGALVTGAINTALATPAPGQAVAATPPSAPAKATNGALPPATPPIHS